MTSAGSLAREEPLLRRGFVLEWVPLGWNVAGITVLAIAATAARSVALAGFGLDSLIEIGASTVVIWELSGTGADSLLAAAHVRQTAGALSVLLFGGGAATGLVSLMAQATFRRARVNSPAPPA